MRIGAVDEPVTIPTESNDRQFARKRGLAMLLALGAGLEGKNSRRTARPVTQMLQATSSAVAILSRVPRIGSSGSRFRRKSRNAMPTWSLAVWAEHGRWRRAVTTPLSGRDSDRRPAHDEVHDIRHAV